MGGGRDCEENYYYNYFFGGVGIVRIIIITIIFFWGVGIVRRIIIIIIFFRGVGIVRSKMPVTRREVKRSSEVGDLRLSRKSCSWNFFWGG